MSSKKQWQKKENLKLIQKNQIQKKKVKTFHESEYESSSLSTESESNSETNTAKMETVLSIKDLSVENTNWVIEGRVSSKFSIKKCKNNIEGQLFSFIIIDDTSEIKLTVFNELIAPIYNSKHKILRRAM